MKIWIYHEYLHKNTKSKVNLRWSAMDCDRPDRNFECEVLHRLWTCYPPYLGQQILLNDARYSGV